MGRALCKANRSNNRQPAARIRDPQALNAIARELRRQVIRMVAPSAMATCSRASAPPTFFATLYFSELRLDPADSAWPDRDRLLLSTAHNTAIFYATLAARGCISSTDSLATYTRDGSALEVNASERMGPVVEATCGSLGQGLSVGVGMALSARRRGRDSRVYIILGDGEMQEGQVWEAAMAAGSHRLSNLCLIIDYNKMQVAGHVDSVVNLNPIPDKWRSFGFRVDAVDGKRHRRAARRARPRAGVYGRRPPPASSPKRWSARARRR